MPRLDAVTLKQLRALIAVADHRSLTDAAAEQRLSTPAIHSQIKGLEQAVGRPLLTRPSEGAAFLPTPEGAVLLEIARRMTALLSQAGDQIRALGAGMAGHVTIGTVSTAKYFAPHLVAMLNRACPDIEIALRVANRSDTLADLARGEYDLAIMGRPPRDFLQNAMPLGPHPHGVIVPPGHALAGQDGFDPARLLDERFLSREPGSGTRLLMERFLDRMGESVPPKLIEMDSNETIKQAVIAGLGVAFLSLHTVVEELRAGRLVLLRGQGLPVMRHWYLIVPGGAPSAAAQRIAAQITGLNGAYFPDLGVNG
ncbi:LysR family transcriptional regulator [Rhodobacter sp. NTK016B]|uniref:LysR substrate-binding domain-containing protein n=1 Tax=Rhodobacter sp. NTK016B TaxID=2759676 RepID=UPI001A8C60A1|nr:LysR substrate-binding domain-containing protein [Rhodobacter sp. NTK016B]MBN8293988.1 LysR family transcriptional regulator [Rhodobacter sp. NTK016B]